MIYIHRRNEWSRAGWGGTMYTVPLGIRTVFMLHWEGGNPTRDTDASAMRAIDTMHRNRGWCGIGYNFVGMQNGSIWEGRGWSYVGAHCPAYNRIGIGVQLHVGGDEQSPTDALRTSVEALYVDACRRAGHRLRILGHRDGYATECPGDRIEQWLRGGMKIQMPDPTPTPGVAAPAYPLRTGYYFGPRFPLSNARSVSGYYSHRNDLRTWQTRMHQRGWDIKADGLYGPETLGVARGFQREKHLTIDGLIGPSTWRAAWEEPVV